MGWILGSYLLEDIAAIKMTQLGEAKAAANELYHDTDTNAVMMGV